MILPVVVSPIVPVVGLSVDFPDVVSLVEKVSCMVDVLSVTDITSVVVKIVG